MAYALAQLQQTTANEYFIDPTSWRVKCITSYVMVRLAPRTLVRSVVQTLSTTVDNYADGRQLSQQGTVSVAVDHSQLYC